MQSERLDVILGLISKHAKNSETGNVLLVGCGSGDDMSLDPSAFGIDLSLQSLRNTKTRFNSSRVAQGDAQALPFAGNTLDLVICSEVIEHLPNRDLFFSEAYRILRYDGVLILTTPNWKSWYGLARWTAEKISGHPVTAAGQPIDRWSTLEGLQDELVPEFNLLEAKGIWYYPPMGRGYSVLPFPFSAIWFYLFLPIEKTFRNIFPGWGHMIAVVVKKHTVDKSYPN